MKLIDSKYTERGYKELGVKLSDWNQATLIWNKPFTLRKDTMKALSELWRKTLDVKLKKQIKERIDYEEQIVACFQENYGDRYIYVVRGYKDECAWGYFSRYETAYIQARKAIGLMNIGIQWRWMLKCHLTMILTKSQGHWCELFMH